MNIRNLGFCRELEEQANQLYSSKMLTGVRSLDRLSEQIRQQEIERVQSFNEHIKSHATLLGLLDRHQDGFLRHELEQAKQTRLAHSEALECVGALGPSMAQSARDLLVPFSTVAQLGREMAGVVNGLLEPIEKMRT